jgi:hypothetical protein
MVERWSMFIKRKWPTAGPGGVAVVRGVPLVYACPVDGKDNA